MKRYRYIIPKIMLLLFAIWPLTEEKDFLYLAVFISIAILLLISIIDAFQPYKDDKESFLIRIYGTRRDAIFDCFLSIIAILSLYLAHHSLHGTEIWWCLLVTTIILPLPRRENKM